ncbi:glycosyltransferase [Lactobacillus crispatus]|uniref:glycosyltransferase n=1 Tax=Lactobacillus crispatus TaxID=47770 RepID=UPI00123BD044|nr:glycosyltransferase [Lactobacillus crispatus]KAA8808143.1 glycosyltransferase [Lactobacillus crispatus]
MKAKMKKKKVLFLIHTLGGGGAEKVLVNLVNNLDRKKYDITVMTIIDTGIYRSALKSDIKYKTILKLPNNRKRNMQTSGSLLNSNSKKNWLIHLYTKFWQKAPLKLIHKLFIGNNYDIEIAFLEGISAKLIANSSNSKAKKYVWIHVDLLQQHKSKNVFSSFKDEQTTYNKFNKIICVSDIVKSSFIKLFDNIDRSKVIVKHNIIDRNEIIRKSKLQNKFVNNKFTICSVGRLNQQKNYLRLAKCAYLLHKKDKLNFNVWILGEGTQKSIIEKYIKDHKMKNYFHLVGFVKNPYSILKKADMFVCSSNAEGYSTSVVEALILGLPVVTTDCAGMREIFSNTQCGIITKQSTDALYNGIKKVLDTPNLYATLKKNAIQRGKAFQLENNVKEIEKIL